MELTDKRSIFWVGSSLKDLKKLPQEVQDTFNFGMIQVEEINNEKKENRRN